LDFFRILMGTPLFQSILGPVFRPILRPASRILLGLIAVPLFRFVLRRIFRIQELSRELEKDLQEWFRGSLLLLAATANMEHLLFGWFINIDWLDRADWLTMGLRLLMVIGVIQTMPDQELFAVLHPGPPKFQKGIPLLQQIRTLKWQILKGHLCRHINKSSPVLAMMCAIVGGELSSPPETDVAALLQQRHLMCNCFVAGSAVLHAAAPAPILHSASEALFSGGAGVGRGPGATAGASDRGVVRVADLSVLLEWVREVEEYRRSRTRFFVGWICYFAAITQYLIIGLVTSRDRAAQVLSLFDRAVADRRRELIEEYQLDGKASEKAP
jgi:hypothetical protein